MYETANLKLPLIAPSQAQKHVTHNEALQRLDGLTQLAVRTRSLRTPPEAPQHGDRYLIPLDANASWQQSEDKVAIWQDGDWSYLQPVDGWLLWIVDEGSLVVRAEDAWIPAVRLDQIAGLGINASFDTTNRLAVASAASLLSHDGDDHRLTINKKSTTDTASVLFQRNFAGFAEMGLVGSDDFRFKVSADGATWREAISIDRTSGEVAFPSSQGKFFQTVYEEDSQSMPADQHVVVSNVSMPFSTSGETTMESGVWTVGGTDAGLWLLTAFAQFNNSDRALLSLEISRDDGVTWEVACRVQDQGDVEISRTVSFSPVQTLESGDKFRFLVYQSSASGTERALRFFSSAGKRL